MGKVINFAARLAERKQQEEERKIIGWLIWLYCSQCNTIEYTEMRIEGGRIHKCGTLVEEKGVEIDIRAEYTISVKNLLKLDQWEKQQDSSKIRRIIGGAKKLIAQFRDRELEYQSRLQAMIYEKIQLYPDTWEANVKDLGITETEPIGLQITMARQGSRYFNIDS